MTTAAAKLIGFAGALVLLFGATFGVARAVSPQGLAGRGGSGMAAHGGGHSSDGGMDMGTPVGSLPGLTIEQDGYRLVPEATTLAASGATPFRFRIDGPDGRPLQAYEQLHERELHLIVVRRDLTGFQHVHPARATDGTWSIALDLQEGGTWRAFADMAPKGGPDQLTLGVDLQVAGPFAPGTGPSAAATPPVGLDVDFARHGSEIDVTVRRDGRPVEPEPYLGARGHLVALRAGDLAYLHVHPVEGAHGTAVPFEVDAPAGSYALFFDYQLDGIVHTATATLEVTR